MMGASMDGYNLNFSKMPLFWRSMIFKCWQGDVRFAYLGAVRVSYKHVDQSDYDIVSPEGEGGAKKAEDFRS